MSASEQPEVEALPGGRTLGLAEVYRDLTLPAGTERPHVALGMVSSVDGAVTIGGASGHLGGAGDRVAFAALRGACDAILVGATTVRIEDYGPPSDSENRVRGRRERGLADRPTIVVVTRSADLDPGARLFRDPSYRPIVVTTQIADAAALEAVAEVVRLGERSVDLGEVLDLLAARGLRRVLAEGGPSLNAQLLAGGLVDEVFLTVAPTLVGGDAPRVMSGGDAHPTALRLVGLVRVDDELLLRYSVGSP